MLLKLTAFLAFASAVLSSAEPSYIAVSGGLFNLRGSRPNVQIQLEYRSGFRMHESIVPLGGLLVTSHGSTYFYGGLGIDFLIRDRFSLFPSFSAGIYAPGKGAHLHGPLIFRSSIEGAYIFKNRSRIGIQFSHLSNAGLKKANPGAESFVISCSFPIE